jgi:hypothetical protein
MRNDGTVYKNLREAQNAICLDAGFNPFLQGGMRAAEGGPIYRHLTLAAATALGYPVARSRKTKLPA